MNSPRATGGVSYKQGIVAESRPGFARVRFDDLDGLVTAWLPLVHPKTFLDKAVWTLDVGEQASCLLDEYMEAGCILGAVYSEADAPPVASPDKFRLQFKDGGSFEYDRASGAMTVISKGVVDVTADGAVTVKAPSVTLDTPVTTCTGQLVVQKLLAYQGGMTGKGGSGAAASIQGNIQVTSGDVQADDISLKTHKTSGVIAGGDTSSVPVP
ncbi:MAG: phage baseplate assembly protein V [Candidatus Accumulibacter sp.]|jgi:phage baseplate assembly protein V|nr:phage baseplate assembly protein V [Accumulibacter sp.]